MHGAWIVALVVGGFVASLSSAAVGIGGGLLVMPVLALWFPARTVVALSTPMFFASSLVNFLRYRHQISGRAYLWMIPGVLLGILIGAFMLQGESPLVIRWVMAGIALIFATQEVYRLVVRRAGRAFPLWSAVPVTLLAGIASSLTNIGGTVVSMALMGQELSPTVFVGTLNAIMVSMTGLKLILFTHLGLLTWHGWILALPSVPAILLGSYWGQKLNRRFSPTVFRWFIIAIIVVSASLLVVGV